MSAKKYMNGTELFDTDLKAAKADQDWDRTLETVVPEYLHSYSPSKKEVLHLWNFDVNCCVRYGSNEGIVGWIYIKGRYQHGQKNDETCSIGIVKTLCRGRIAYVALHKLCGIICYYANEFVRNNPDRFD